MYATQDKKGRMKVSLTLTFKVNCQCKVIGFVFVEIPELKKVRIDTEILSSLYIVQPEIRKVMIVYIYDLDFEGQSSRSSDLFQFSWDSWPQKCQNGHHDQLWVITSLVMKGQVQESSTSNFKVTWQRTWFNLTFMKSSIFILLKTTPISLLYPIYIKRYLDLQIMVKTVHFDHHHGHLTSWHVSRDRWCHICQNVSPIHSNRYDEAIFAIGIIKTVTRRNASGWYPSPS